MKSTNSFSIENIHFGTGVGQEKLFATLYDEWGLEYTASLDEIVSRLYVEMKSEGWKKRTQMSNTKV